MADIITHKTCRKIIQIIEWAQEGPTSPNAIAVDDFLKKYRLRCSKLETMNPDLPKPK